MHSHRVQSNEELLFDFGFAILDNPYDTYPLTLSVCTAAGCVCVCARARACLCVSVSLCVQVFVRKFFESEPEVHSLCMRVNSPVGSRNCASKLVLNAPPFTCMQILMGPVPMPVPVMARMVLDHRGA